MDCDSTRMDINALLDLDVVAVESEDNLSVLLELVAPERAVGDQRPPGTLQVVLDRSGSMGDGRLHAAQAALEALISRLDAADNFGLVVFDDEANVVIPAGPLTNKRRPGRGPRRVAGVDDEPLGRLPTRVTGGPPRQGRGSGDAAAALRWTRESGHHRSRSAGDPRGPARANVTSPPPPSGSGWGTTRL